MAEPIAAHEEHKILEAPVFGSRWVPRWCTTCNVKLEPREETDA